MRTLEECKAEIFRRSEARIARRRKVRRRMLVFCLPLCLALLLCTASLPMLRTLRPGDPAVSTDGEFTEGKDAGNRAPGGDGGGETNGGSHLSPESFSFSLTWGCGGNSYSFDSKTGRLGKVGNAGEAGEAGEAGLTGGASDTQPECYAVCRLSKEETLQIYRLIEGLDITSYPTVYDPQAGDPPSDSSMTLILSVRTERLSHTVTAGDIPCSFAASDPRGQKFLNVCKGIIEILTGKEEWKTLPEPACFSR